MNRSQIRRRLTQIAKAYEWAHLLSAHDIHELGQEQHQLEDALDRLSVRPNTPPMYYFAADTQETCR